MSPSGSAKFLARDEAEADDISKRLSNAGLKNEINHFEQARDRDVNGVAHLVALEADKATKPVKQYRCDWVDGKALITFRGQCIAEAVWVTGAVSPKRAAAENGYEIAGKLNEHAALVAVAEALQSIRDLADDPAGSTYTLKELFGTFQHGEGVPEIEGKKAIQALANLAAVRKLRN